MGRVLLKRELLFCIKSILMVGGGGGGGVGGMGSRVHQSKSWYDLGLFQIFKVELLAKIVSGYKPLTLFLKSSNLDISLVS